jgi:farnesyl diphosphate synthase
VPPHPPPPILADNFGAWAKWARAATAQTLDDYLPPSDGGGEGDDKLAEAMRAATLGGGKRLRPMLCLAAAQAISGEVSASALRAAAAVEMIHCYSLAHDDLPCMDDDDKRRGKPACHIQFGEAIALLAGDCLQSCAFAALAPNGAQAIAALADAAGFAGMCGGQALDLAADENTISEAENLRQIHRRKTGALFCAALRLGALCADADDKTTARLDAFGRAFGLMFQIADDIADGAADIKHPAKPTFLALFGVEEATRLLDAYRREALAALDDAPFVTFHLRALADTIAAPQTAAEKC